MNKWMDAILRTIVIVFIDTARKINVIIEQVFRAMSQIEANGHDQPGQPGEVSISPRQETCNHTGKHGELGYSPAGSNQPLGDEIQRIPFFLLFQLDGPL